MPALPPALYTVLTAILVLGVLAGISMMSRVKTARIGNALSALCSVLAILIALYQNGVLSAPVIWAAIAVGTVFSLIAAARVKMIQMPQVVAFLNGLGGLSSALVAVLSANQAEDALSVYVSLSALAVGSVTFAGSMVAAGKLAKVLPQKSVVWKAHSLINGAALLSVILSVVIKAPVWIVALLSAVFGVTFSIRVGGADMPITISLLNSLSGVAGGIAGIAVKDLMLVAVGGIVGASGLLLTQVMCRAMNRRLSSILLGYTAGAPHPAADPQENTAQDETSKESSEPKNPEPEPVKEESPGSLLAKAKKVMIVPGYGMALAQAQAQVKQLADRLEANGCEVKFVIHPVAGRMPGHMNVLLCEVDVPYDQLYEMDAVNDEFRECDVCVIIGANDVVNPAANTAEGTPIYGMPVLRAGEAKQVLVCNFDDKPGYAGVPNPLYTQPNTIMLLGDAKDTLDRLLKEMNRADGAGEAQTAAEPEQAKEESPGELLANAKKVMIIPGYGMALAQAQAQVKQLADKLEANGCQVKYVIHPVAGRMPGHMNVLLCEVDVPYDQLYEMDAVNDEFRECDVCVIIGANDVVNPAANTAEGTPIYGMPILRAGEAKHVIVCNYDDKPGYAGVPNPLYTQPNTIMLLGDAKDTLTRLISLF